MAASVTQISVFSCSATTPAGTSGETTGLCLNRADTRSGTSEPIPIPTSTSGTNYSYPKYLGLEVVTTGTTSIENRQVARSSAAPAGILLYWATSSSFVTPAAVIGVANTSADDVDPDGATTNWTALTTTYVAYSTASATTVAGLSGKYAKIGIGVSSTGTYTGGPGSAIALPDLLFQYDEAAVRSPNLSREDWALSEPLSGGRSLIL